MRNLIVLFVLIVSSNYILAAGQETLTCEDRFGHIQINGLGNFPAVRLAKISNGNLSYESFRPGIVKVLSISEEYNVDETEGADCDEYNQGVRWLERKFTIDVRIFNKRRKGPFRNFKKHFVKQTDFTTHSGDTLVVVEGSVECKRVYTAYVGYNCAN